MSIQVQQPQPYDLVGSSVQIAGTAGGAFEASYSVRVTEGHDEVLGHFMAGDGIGGHGQFQVAVDISGAAFTHTVAFVEVFHTSARDGSELDRQVVPVIVAPLIVPGYTTYLEHVVAPGESLWAIAQRHYGNGNLYHRLVAANPIITNPNLIHPGDVVRVPRAG
ncbi:MULTISPECIES: Gmad2 immunoglobulin-like domain-containing protein [unclassified Ornithinimicrobium]|uniref:Gmad2 immunoglobulin-like domain-containing protein n=1 Tax=unclassified Ornithinimicrobium TaxID=2615080 RepID=UPI003852B472